MITPTILLNKRFAIRTLPRLLGFPFLTCPVLVMICFVLVAALAYVPGDAVTDTVGVVTDAAFEFVDTGGIGYGGVWTVEFAAFAEGVYAPVEVWEGGEILAGEEGVVSVGGCFWLVTIY